MSEIAIEEKKNGTERDGMGRNGTERDGTGRNGTERDGTGRNRTEQDGTGRNGTERDKKRYYRDRIGFQNPFDYHS